MELRAYVQHTQTHRHTPSLSVCTIYTAGVMISQHHSCVKETTRPVTALLTASCQQLCRISVTVLFDSTVN